jgi:hypothetical protein
VEKDTEDQETDERAKTGSRWIAAVPLAVKFEKFEIDQYRNLICFFSYAEYV